MTTARTCQVDYRMRRLWTTADICREFRRSERTVLWWVHVKRMPVLGRMKMRTVRGSHEGDYVFDPYSVREWHAIRIAAATTKGISHARSDAV